MAKGGVAILGIFVADLAFRSQRMPAVGETIAGSGFAMGPGGKGSNQAVAAARLGVAVSFISKLGRDAFGDIAVATWEKEGITPRVARTDEATGAAFIYVNETNGENAIILVPGAAGSLSPTDVDAARAAIASPASSSRSSSSQRKPLCAGWRSRGKLASRRSSTRRPPFPWTTPSMRSAPSSCRTRRKLRR